MAYRELLIKLMESHSICSEFVIIRAGGCILSVRKNEFTQGAKKKKVVEKISY